MKPRPYSKEDWPDEETIKIADEWLGHVPDKIDRLVKSYDMRRHNQKLKGEAFRWFKQELAQLIKAEKLELLEKFDEGEGFKLIKVPRAEIKRLKDE